MRAGIAIVLVACGSEPAPPVAIDGIPVIPIGYDAYRQIDAMPRVRIGDRAYLRSTYDRSGHNEAADASHYLRQADDGTYVTLDVAGSGYLAFARANHWHGSPWHYTVDGVDHVVSESSTADPYSPVANATFEPEHAFPAPLAETWATTRGADVSWVPMPFERSLAIAHERTHYGTGYYIYHLFAPGADHLSAPLRAWDEDRAAADVAALLRDGFEPPGDDHAAVVDVPAQGSVRALDLAGPAAIRELAIDAPASIADARLVIRWDGRATPSVDAPVALLFGAGTLAQDGTIVKSLLAQIRRDGERVRATLRFPMPFASSATINLVGAGAAITDVRVTARSVADPSPAAQGYFHATYVDHGEPVPGRDLLVLDTTTIEDGGAWCGTFNGMAFTFSDRGDLGTLEGDPRMFFDDAASPQGHGTGTEEWAAGGDYWGGEIVTLPLAGHPTADPIESAYRFLIADAMPFGTNARIQLEHGGDNESTEHYRTVAYWYGRPGACLVLGDTLDVGDLADEARHRYRSFDASPPYTLTTAFDGANAPATTDTARVTTGVSEFTLAIDPGNRGVLLRRTLDLAYGDQRALVWVADDERSLFVLAGTWYTAGSTSVIYSNPPGELDPGEHVLQTAADRRWRDDEFLLPRQLTEGRSSIRVHVHSIGTPHALYPGGPVPPTGWSEARYRAYSYVL